MRADFLIVHADEILTCRGPAPRIGRAFSDTGRIADGALAADGGRVVFAGPSADCERTVTRSPDATVIDGRGLSVVPGFVDPHTHVVFAGDRRDELRRRLAGATYAEIAAGGGGILSTVRATRAATVDDLVAAARPRLAAMLSTGTTTAEAKSGYGLTVASELTQLRAIRRLSGEQPVELAATLLGAHEIPQEYRERREAYVRLIIDEMIPATMAEGLAEWCDVFCEREMFTPEESTAILEAAKSAGLKPRIHANELGSTGGARVAARVGARSADHLVFVDEAEAQSLADAGVVATLLPAAAFFLKLGRFAPARALVEAGVAVALATDVNPGGGLTTSMPFVMTLACFGMGLTFEEALVASTLNAAHALDRADRIGSLEAGKQCDAVLVAGPAVDLLRVGGTSIHAVIKAGRVVHSGP